MAQLKYWNGSAWVAASIGAQGTDGAPGAAGIQGAQGIQGIQGVFGGGLYTFSPTPPSTPNVGDRWINSDNGSEYTYIYDGDTFQWVDTRTAGFIGAQGIQGTFGPATIVQNYQTSAYVLSQTDNGKYIDITSGGVSVTVATGMTPGQNVMIYNNSSSSQTITQGPSILMRLAGTTTTGSRTLAQYGVATILCVGIDTYVISGTGIS